MKEGVVMLIKHIAANKPLFCQIDSDNDGYTAGALLLNYLYKLFPTYTKEKVIYRVHDTKAHGVVLDTIPEGIELVIIPDAGSNQYEEHAVCAERGIQVLVLDHHEAEYESPHACIINNQLGNYPNKSLSGAGVVYKFCSYIDELLGVNYANEFLDLAAFGIIGDVMELRDFETKHIIDQGLNNVNNEFFKAMIDKQDFYLKGEVTPFGIAFYIVPYINAVIRVGTLEEKQVLFDAMLTFKGEELIPSTKRGCKGQNETRIAQACRICTNAKNKQTKIRDENLETIEQIINDNNLLDNKLLVIKLENFSADKNLTGLIANCLMGKYQRPVLLLNKVENVENVVTVTG